MIGRSIEQCRLSAARLGCIAATSIHCRRLPRPDTSPTAIPHCSTGDASAAGLDAPRAHLLCLAGLPSPALPLRPAVSSRPGNPGTLKRREELVAAEEGEVTEILAFWL